MVATRLLAALVATSLLISAAAAQAAIDGTAWISLDTHGTPGNLASGSYSYPPALNANGELIAFESLAELDFDRDTNGVGDIYLRDTANAQTSLVSVNSNGDAGNGRSLGAAMSADGNAIVFESLASDLVAVDANGASDIYLRDRGAGTTRRVSVFAASGEANGSSYRPSISADGNFVAFCSRASNLVEDDGNGLADAFIWERSTGAITRVAIPGTPDPGAEGCLRVALSADGSALAFSAAAGATTAVYVHDRASGTTAELTQGTDGPSGSAGLAISGDGQTIAFDSSADNLISDDTNGSRDVFIYNRASGAVSRASVRSSGSQLPGDSGGSGISLSEDGNFLVFGSMAKGVVAGDSNAREDVFRRDLAGGKTFIVSVNVFGESANNSSYSPGVSADGSVVAFASLAANLVAGDSNRQPDIFVRAKTFLESAGAASGPEDTGAPEEEESGTAVERKDEGLPPAVIYGAIGAGVFLVVAAGWLFLGRRGRA